MSEPSFTVGIIGAGTMGSGITTVMVRSGHRTVLRDTNAECLVTGGHNVARFLDKSVSIGKMSSAEARRAKDNLVLSAQDADLSECDVVVEAIHEDLKAKQELFRHLSDVCKPETLFHTNTSTLSVTAIAAGASNPERVVGTHYCNPAPLMKLVEVVRGQLTSDDTYSRTIGFIASLDKKSVTTKDVPGFIVNRFLIPFENNCIRSLESGVGTVESIDLAVRHGLRHPMGPFTLLDIVGLDVHRAVSLSLYEQLRDPRFAPPPLVERMVAAGQLGRKVGQGFYNYDQAGLIGT